MGKSARVLAGMGLLSGAALLLQVALTRVFSIAQFYHFAFLVVSLALLGFGASGSLLALWPRLRERAFHPWYALGFGVTALLAYLFVNYLPFNLLALAVPFVFVGALVGALLSTGASEAGRIYGANLLGSALGAVLPPAIIADRKSTRLNSSHQLISY